MTEDRYQDIRPYSDEEVQPALRRLITDTDFINTLTDLHPRLRSGWMRPIKKYLIQRNLSQITSGIHSVLDVQQLVKKYIDDMLAQSVDTFSVTGLRELMDSHKGPFLFIGNHRDIVLDPALINYALHTHDYPTSRIAIGDNLTTTPWVGDLMKLNKSFIVKRSLSAPREKLMAFKELSSYIHHSLSEEKSSIWIAQSEGRAKDGNDRTQPAIIKMIAMAKDRQVEFADYIRSLQIVPVAISYQYDPCDAAKARELYIRETTGTYAKTRDEDFDSIMSGLSGNKGDVTVSFGTVLSDWYDDAAAVAKAIDRQIHDLYHLSDTNLTAQQYLDTDAVDIDHELYHRISDMPRPHQSYAWRMYAQAAINKKEAITHAE